MTRFYSLLFALLMSTALLAQSPPQSFSYQTVIRDAGFNVMANQEVVLRLSILEDEPQGLMVYQEKHVETTSAIGLVNLFIGEGNLSSGSFEDIDWANHTYFLQVEIDFDSDDTFIIMGTSQLRSVPYALYALNAGNTDAGLVGPQGEQGEQGIQGDTGAQGLPGTNGIDGADGQDGTNGTNGLPGADGTNGNNGAQGPIGLTGQQGIQGIQGETGEQGLPGFPGINGQDGEDGVDGLNGTQGVQGETGAQGPIGLTGQQGIQGETGEQGLPGFPGTNGQDGNDGIDAVVDYDSLANLISIDSSFTANVSSGMGGGGCNYSFPEGIGESIVWDLGHGNNDYTVPAGKNLFITNVHVNDGSSFRINGIRVIDETWGTSGSPAMLILPLCVKANEVVSGSSNALYTETFHGILTDAIVEPISFWFDDPGTGFDTYTVPAGKKLFITNIWAYGGVSSSLTIDGVIIGGEPFNKPGIGSNKILEIPLIINSGSVVSIPDNFASFNGYLVDENYFAGCGGGGSSSSASNATIDSLTQLVSNLDSTVNALTSQINFGCTDSSASNYNSSSNIDDGSCTYPTPQLAIGDTYQGGIIFNILEQGDLGYVEGEVHGLIAATSDQSTATKWGCYGTNISGADGIYIGTGNQNTIDIYNSPCLAGNDAADICYNLSLNGYDDWFLPSKDELYKMYLNIGQGNALGLGNIGGFSEALVYWSSSEYNSYQSYVKDFGSINQPYTLDKDVLYYVRAIRAF